MPAAGSLLTAVDTKTRSPQTIGLETATPGDRRLPQHVLAGRDVPLHRRRRAVGDAGGRRVRGTRASSAPTATRRRRTTERAASARRMIYLPSTRVHGRRVARKADRRHLVAFEADGERDARGFGDPERRRVTRDEGEPLPGSGAAGQTAARDGQDQFRSARTAVGAGVSRELRFVDLELDARLGAGRFEQRHDLLLLAARRRLERVRQRVWRRSRPIRGSPSSSPGRGPKSPP